MLTYLLLLGVLACTTYGQIVLKARAKVFSIRTEGAFYFVSMLIDPWVLSGLVAAVIAGFLWLAAIRRVELSFAYPFVALTFVFVPIMSYYVLDEPLPAARIAGIALIVLGVVVAAKPA